MPILIRDETANATVLTIDNNGNLAFADGTPINMLTLNGYGIIDSEGYIVHGFGSNAVLPNTGSLSVGYTESATIETAAQRLPLAAIDTFYPARSYRVDPAGGLHVDTITGSTIHVLTPDTGQFTIYNVNVATADVMQNPTWSRLPNQNATVRYRWI